MSDKDSQHGCHIPSTISPEAQDFLRGLADQLDVPPMPGVDDSASWEELFSQFELAFQEINDEVVARYLPVIESAEIKGIPVLDIRPQDWAEDSKIIVYLHGGAYTLFSARSTLSTSVPVAADCDMRVIAVDYTRAPMAQWQQVTDEVIKVLTGLWESGYKPADTILFGDSAGGSLAASTVLKMRDTGLQVPAALVLWSPWADITNSGDSYHTLAAEDPCYQYETHLAPCALAYAEPDDHRHPYVSPVYGNFNNGFPPTLIQGGTKEIFLSNSVRLYQALDTAGCTVKLDLYEGMIHVFQCLAPQLPESIVARKKMADFVRQQFVSGR